MAQTTQDPTKTQRETAEMGEQNKDRPGYFPDRGLWDTDEEIRTDRISTPAAGPQISLIDNFQLGQGSGNFNNPDAQPSVDYGAVPFNPDVLKPNFFGAATKTLETTKNILSTGTEAIGGLGSAIMVKAETAEPIKSPEEQEKLIDAKFRREVSIEWNKDLQQVGEQQIQEQAEDILRITEDKVTLADVIQDANQNITFGVGETGLQKMGSSDAFNISMRRLAQMEPEKHTALVEPGQSTGGPGIVGNPEVTLDQNNKESQSAVQYVTG